jgi:tetratricopeptide (TPR) repeat protein
VATARRYLTILTLIAASVAAQKPGTAPAHFAKGLSWLHSFEYDDARDEFRKARELDPALVMAYWGEALSYTEPIWQAQDIEGGRAALRRLAATREERLARAANDRERLYLRAIEALYGEGDYRARTLAYEEAMRQLVARYPDDLDAAALYSLAILATSFNGRDFRIYMRAAAVAEDVYARDPKHPGALHYLIHCYDDPVHAPLGLRAARRYGSVAPEAPHALHMPSHIFIAMGMWDDVVASNEASWNASESRLQAKKLGVEDRGYHALYWLHYALLQQGRYAEAGKLLAIAEADARKSGLAYVRSHWALMRAHHALETRDWSVLEQSIDLTELDASAAASDVFARAFAFVVRKDSARARSMTGGLRRLNAPRSAHTAHGSPAPDRVVAIVLKEAEAITALAEGRTSAGIALLKEAAALEDATPYEFGPPVPPKPAHELLAEVLLARGRAQEAREHFARALQRTPRRSIALRGLAAASRVAGDPAASRAVLDELKQIRRRADRPFSETQP